MKYYEQAYIAVQRDRKSSTRFEGPQAESVTREDVTIYLRKKQKKKLLAIIGVGFMVVLVPAIMLVMYLCNVKGMTVTGILITAGVMLAIGAVLFIMIKKEYDALSPLLYLDRFAPSALEDKLRRERKLSWKNDLVSVASILKGSPYYLAPVSSTGARPDSSEKNQLALLVQEYMQRPGADKDAVYGRFVSPLEAAVSAAVDLRSPEERQMEQDGSKRLGHKEETLAQEMAAFLQSHDTGNNPEDLEAFRESFRSRAEQVAVNGGRRALQKVYYRVRYLCAEKGADFHAGALDYAFEGQYWQR